MNTETSTGKGEYFSMKNKIDITPKTLIGELLDAYPELEERFIEIAPVFKKLKNPFLRRTITKITTLKQASVIANISIADLINQLRKFVDHEEIIIESDISNIKSKPEWVKGENIKFEYDATIDLENGNHPAAKVTKDILHLEDDDLYLLITPFIPAPLIKIIEEKGYTTFTEEKNSATFHTYIKSTSKNYFGNK